MKKWHEVAEYIEEELGGEVNWDEEYYVCPECGEIIDASDWWDHADFEVCPICWFNLITGEEEPIMDEEEDE